MLDICIICHTVRATAVDAVGALSISFVFISFHLTQIFGFWFNVCSIHSFDMATSVPF